MQKIWQAFIFLIISCSGEQRAPQSRLHIVQGENLGDKDIESDTVVALSFMDDTAAMKGSVFCTGTIVDPEWVVTAAHCVWDFVNYTPPPPIDLSPATFTPEAWQIVQNDPTCLDRIRENHYWQPPANIYLSLGANPQIDDENDLLNPELEYIPIKVNRSNIIPHPSFVGGFQTDPYQTVDIALIRIPPGSSIARRAKGKSRLISNDEFRQMTGGANRLFVGGFGSVHSTMTVYSQVRTCDHIISLGVETLHRQSGLLRRRSIRHIRPENHNFIASTGACKGDSGGPAYVLKGDQLLLAGVVSSEHVENEIVGPIGGSASKYEVIEQCINSDTLYVSIPQMRNWLQRQMGLKSTDGDGTDFGNDNPAGQSCRVGNLSGDAYVNVRSGPGTSYGIIAKLYDNETVVKISETPGFCISNGDLGMLSRSWTEVQLPAGDTGYVSSLYLNCSGGGALLGC